MDETTFLGRRDDGPPVLLLAGRAWRVTHLDWKRRRAHVELAEDAGRSRWRGGGQLLGHALCWAIRKVLADDAARPGWARRAVARMEMIRAEYPWLSDDEANVLLVAEVEVSWWSFAGGRANAALAHEPAARLDAIVTSDNFAVRFPRGVDVAPVADALDGLRGADPGCLVAPAGEQAIDGLKFSECLPRDLAARVVQSRLADARGVTGVLGRALRTVVAGYATACQGRRSGRGIAEDRDPPRFIPQLSITTTFNIYVLPNVIPMPPPHLHTI